MGHFWSQRPEVMRNGARGGYMGKAYTKKEHDKCKQVAEAFQELYAIYGDMCVLDAGDFGFVHLKWFRDGIVCEEQWEKLAVYGIYRI